MMEPSERGSEMELGTAWNLLLTKEAARRRPKRRRRSRSSNKGIFGMLGGATPRGVNNAVRIGKAAKAVIGAGGRAYRYMR